MCNQLNQNASSKFLRRTAVDEGLLLIKRISRNFSKIGRGIESRCRCRRVREVVEIESFTGAGTIRDPGFRGKGVKRNSKSSSR
jgi:hypothetical protein